MTHYMHLKEGPFNKIWNDKKTIELRLYDEKRRNIQVGDFIHFENDLNPNQIIETEVTKLHLFENFSDLYKSLPLEKCGYEVNEINDADPSDMNQYYSIEEQSKFGVVGIEFVVRAKKI